MSQSSPRWLAVTAVVFGVTLSACGSSGGGSPATAATPAATTTSATAATNTSATAVPLPSQAATAAAASCPTGATVGAALGISLPNPVSAQGGGGTSLPAGATGVACEYAGKGLNVIIELIRNISPTYIDQFSSKYPVPYKSVSGVGNQARSFLAPLNGGKDNEGVVATKGSNLVAITATDTPASLAQIEALVNQLRSREELCRIAREQVVVNDRKAEEIVWTPPARPFFERQRECPQGALGTRPLSDYDEALAWWVA
ncbi:MAG: hypothetical protein ABSA21_14135 [Candidatus Limnocylindrales bacterium]